MSIKGNTVGTTMPRPDWNQTDPKKADFIRNKDSVNNHLTNKNNPHGVTASQVGARPNTWMPSATDVGARPNTWLPTIAEIGAAPAGYGLGVYSQLLTSADDLNNIKANGWYRWYMNDAPANAPTEYAWSAFQVCRVWTLDGGVCLQEVVDLGYDTRFAGVRVQRTVYGSEIIGSWELENPPLIVGAEYRTTERRNGNPVYTKLVNFGALPSNGQLSAPHGISGLGTVLRCNLATTSTYMVLDFSSQITDITVNATDVLITTNAGLSWVSVNVQLWYTK